MNYWLHLGNILYLLAYSVRDILWLRILTVVATLCLMPYYFCCTARPLLEPIGWCSLFTLVNLVQIARLIMERRPVFLGEEESRVYQMVFSTVSPREFMKLLSIAQWKKATDGQELLRQHEPVTHLSLLTAGRGDVEVDGRHIADVGPGQFVGEMGFLTQQNASASVTARLPVEYLCWPIDQLRGLVEDTPQLHVKVQGILGTDLVKKLRQEGYAVAHASKIMGTYES